MKATSSKAIDWILLVLALLALAFGGFMAYRYYTFPEETYAQELENARSRTAQATAEREEAEKALEADKEAALADISLLGEKGKTLQTKMESVRQENEEKTERLAELENSLAVTEDAQNSMLALRKEYALKIRELEDLIVAGKSDVKICYWTLDDGPSYYTQQFLDYAKEQGIYLTFFTSCEANDSKDERQELRNEAMGGHAICNHTYSHQYAQYGNVYGKGLDSLKEVIQKQNDWVYECTGLKMDIFRFPGGHAWALAHLPEADSVIEELGMKQIEWSCDAMDNLQANPDGDTVAINVVYQVKTMDIAVLLSHDWNGNTLYGMQKAVPQLKEAGYVFLPLFSDSWTMDNTKIMFS